MTFFDRFLEYFFMGMYAITLVIALWKYPKYYTSPLKYFPVLVMYTFLSEFLGYLVRTYDQVNLFLNTLFQNYSWVIYNIYNLVFFSFFFYVYWCSLKKRWQHGYLAIGMLLLVVVSVLNAFEDSFLLESQVYAYITGGGFLLGSIVLFFVQEARDKGRWFDRRELLSWLSLGMFIFYLGYIPIKVYRHFQLIYPIDEPVFVRRLHLTLIVLMYLCFIIGFLMMRNNPLVRRS